MKLAGLYSDFVSLFFPPVCLVCHEALPHNVDHLCVKCRYDLPKTNNHNIQIDRLDEKFQNIIDLKAFYAFCYFQKGGKMQKILHAIKYNEQQELGEKLGRWYGRELVGSLGVCSFDWIVPVPLHQKRLKQRGFNQSESIANGLSSTLKVPVANHLLERNKMNGSLTRQSKVSRIRSLKDTYSVSKNALATNGGLDFLIVDDVMTTGSTIIACFEALQALKPKSISALTLAVVK